MAGSGGPWGGGGPSDDDGKRPDNRPGRGNRRPGENSPLPEFDDLLRKGQDRLRVLMGGRGGGGGGFGPGGDRGPGGFGLNRNTILLGALAAIGLWAFNSFYTVKPEERSVEMFLGKFSGVGDPGLNFAPWPFVSATVIPVSTEKTIDIGVGRGNGDEGLMLTGDENIVDIDFQVVWVVNDPAKFLFNLRDAELTIQAVSESSMREIISQSPLAPILNRDRGAIAARLQEMIQSTLDSYDAGVTIVRINFDRADPPREVLDAFKAVQSAEQERDRLEKEADAYANKVMGKARGDAAQELEIAEGYRASVVNQAEGDASRFTAVLEEYHKAPEVTRKRLYLETMEEVLSRVNKIILDPKVGGGNGVVPFLPLNDLARGSMPGAQAPAAATGGNN